MPLKKTPDPIYGRKREFDRDFVEGTISYHDFVNDSGTKNVRSVQVVSAEYNYAISMIRVADLMVRLLRSPKPLFALGRGAQGQAVMKCTATGRSFEESTGIDFKAIQDEYPGSQFHPHLQLFVRHTENWNLRQRRLLRNECQLSTEGYVDALNGCVAAIREEAQSAAFTRRLRVVEQSMRRNTESMLRKIDQCFDVYGKLLAIRLDIGYRKDFCAPRKDKQLMTEAQARKHLKAFVGYLRRKPLGDWLALYVVRLEHGMFKGFHFHCLLLFNGQMVRDAIKLGYRIGNQWNHVITQGAGVNHLCNAHPERYRHYLGVGMIRHSDYVSRDGRPSRQGLNRAARYLTESDGYLKFGAAHSRSLFIGGSPKQRLGKRRGRPRKIYNERWSEPSHE